MNKEKDIDKLIADKLKKGVDSIPPQEYVAGAWDSFKAISASNAATMRRTRTMRIYRYSAVGAAAMLLIGLFLFTTNNQFFELSKSSLNNSIAVVEKPKFTSQAHGINIEIAGLDLDKPKRISSRASLAVQRQKNVSAHIENLLIAQTKEKEVQTAKEALTISEKEALAISEKEVLAISEKEVLEIKAKEALAIREKETSALIEKEALAINNSKRVFQNDSKEIDKKSLRFGVNVSPGFNSTSTNSGSTFNYSGGVTMDIIIAKNLQISTGVQLEHNNVGGESRVGTRGMAPNHVDAVLTNLDIPLNITWHFFSDKSKSYYVSGGLSSLAYLNEKYTTTTYNNQIKANTIAASGDEQLTTYRIENVETVLTNTVSSPNALDIAGRVNIIFGYEQKLTPKLNLHIEPFIKVPLTGLASENMRFTTGGITFKVSF